MNIWMTDENCNYAFDGHTMIGLLAVMRRLYDEKPMLGDERRDWAQRLHALLEKAEQLP